MCMSAGAGDGGGGGCGGSAYFYSLICYLWCVSCPCSHCVLCNAYAFPVFLLYLWTLNIFTNVLFRRWVLLNKTVFLHFYVIKFWMAHHFHSNNNNNSEQMRPRIKYARFSDFFFRSFFFFIRSFRCCSSWVNTNLHNIFWFCVFLSIRLRLCFDIRFA